jgi:hypothetical protein
MKGNNPTKAGNFKEIDANQTKEWSLRCLSHQQKKLTFELLNLQTKRAHKLIFSGAGTDDITSPDNWVQGLYPLDFNTKFPASFENFDETVAMLTPDGEVSFTHTLRIGWLATLTINQSHSPKLGMWSMFGNCRIEYGNGEPTPAVRSSSGGGVTISAGGHYSGGGAGKVSMNDLSF